jgi:peptide subunit release factor 1 (eRF1)
MSHTQQEQRPLHQFAIWIDHREAILASFNNAHLLHEEELFSGVAPHTHGGGWSQQRIESHRHAVLDHFYEEIIRNLTGADEIIIYGPGQAKHELCQHISRNKALNQRVLDLVITDKLSEHQFICKAVEDFISAHAFQTK